MTTFFDKEGFLHDKPCVDGKPSCNNKFIYTAYAVKTGFISQFYELSQVMVNEINYCFDNGVRHSPEIKKEAPIISRDETLGLSYLSPSIASKLIERDFWMTPNKPKFNLVRFIKQIVPLIKNREDRNYWWKNDLEQMKFLTMKQPLVDRAFIYRCAGKKVPLVYRLIEWVDKKIDSSGRSSRAIRSFKYNLDNNEGIMIYFTLDHPLREHIKKLRGE